MPTPLPSVSRRALLGASAGLVALGAAGCSLDSLDPTADDPTITPTTAAAGSPTDGSASPTGADDGADDGALVESVLAAIAAAHRTARGTRRVHRGLTTALRRAESLHLAHAEELGGLPAATGPATRPGETANQALVRVDRGEGRLQRTLVDAAGSAGSGALAQTLASMAAAVAQLRTTLTPGAAS
ncbi:hypothetical protein [Nocardioides plantarum]|uniref:Lipoprotein n=1 Tax=Nocardioides plantarum TaxID=29299 RepID=A0ABV5KAN1_9ACTN|nr:hypothetical protein [Nocardioides plantarum]